MNAEQQVHDLVQHYVATATAAQRHIFAAQANYDGNAAALQLLIDSPETDLATAMLIFWYLGADYLTRVDPAAMHSFQRDALALVQQIEQRCLSGFYRQRTIHYDPHDSPCHPGEYASEGERITPIHPRMEQPSGGGEWVDLEAAYETYDEGLPMELSDAIRKRLDAP